MLKLIVAYNEDSDARFRLLKHAFPFLVEGYNEDNSKERKHAFNIKSAWGAKMTPFAILMNGDSAVKGWWSEEKPLNVEEIVEYVLEYIKKHSKSGYMTIEKIEGTNNDKYVLGSKQSGYCKYFAENISCYVEKTDRWYATSIVKEIDWENKIFKTLNSTYKFTLDESKNN